jgi:hypothetical protein
VPFTQELREEALVRSGRCCCVCHTHAGRDAETHHIVQEADGGANTLDNAIVLCSKCHGEAGHYNVRHPRGTKYSPRELRRHRDEWWAYRANGFNPAHRPAGFREPIGSGRNVPTHGRDVGVLWSGRADISVARETIEFQARLLAHDRFEEPTVVRLSELFARPDGTFLVYVVTNHRGDWSDAFLDGAPPDHSPLTIEDLHERYSTLASRAGLQRVRRL